MDREERRWCWSWDLLWPYGVRLPYGVRYRKRRCKELCMASKRARKPLSRERALATAMKLADAEGLAGVTMRRLAGKLGVEAMSLYHHLPGKEGLLDGLVEALVGEIRAEVDALTASASWRDDLRARCLAARRVML